MRIRFIIINLFVGLCLTGSSEQNLLQFESLIDAVSFTTHTEEPIVVSYFDGANWQKPLAIGIDADAEIESKETGVVIFPIPIHNLRVDTLDNIIAIHPLQSDTSVVHYEVAALPAIGTPRILSRRQWGADESFTIQTQALTSTSSSEKDASSTSSREEECKELQAKYPQEFTTINKTTTNASGKLLRWTREYSSSIQAIVVHHTAATYSTDSRSGLDKMRLLYAYHSNSKGWGDIGYHYLIDEDGQIYEGKSGGDYVVAGHAYCNNTGTIGIALMGNFNEEQPTVEQTQSLQWLLLDLGKKYSINYARKVQYHGKLIEPVVGHRDLLATQCPGETLDEGLPQIRKNIIAGSYRASVRYPGVAKARIARTPLTVAPSQLGGGRSVTSVIGSTEYTIRPGGSIQLQLQVSAWTQPISQRQSVAPILRSNSQIGVWQYYTNGQEAIVRDRILSTKDLVPGKSLTIPLRIQVPRQAGIYTLTIGTTKVTLNVKGKRLPTDISTPTIESTGVSQRGRTVVTPVVTSTTDKPVFFRSADSKQNIPTGALGSSIRIKLSYDSPTATIDVGSSGTLDGKKVSGTVQFIKQGSICKATTNTITSSQNSPRISASNDELTIRSWNTKFNRFRGTIECQIEADKIILINELPLEQYMWGLAEEPDTEPYEKQRAFAIAARSYAAHYMQLQYRKFPGKQYDGSDSPAVFQKYGGIQFENDHPQWVKAVQSTEQLVIKKNNQIVKAPYFSSDDGRTRSPAENGWSNFLFAEVFVSKKDPWCQDMPLRGHGVGMSGCGAKGQAKEGKNGEQILEYYYPTTQIERL